MRQITMRPAGLSFMLAVAGVYGCASGHAKRPTSDQPPAPVNVEVQNDLAVGTGLTAFVQQTPAKPKLLGDVAPGQVQTFTFTPASYGQQYRLLAAPQAVSSDAGGPTDYAFKSATFSIDSPETGTVVWSVRTGIVSFRNR
jgi:hypothetical protein